MNTWVLIALIVCGTGLVGFLIWVLFAARLSKSIAKSFNDATAKINDIDFKF